MYDRLDIDKNSNSMNFATAQKLEKIYGLYAKYNHKVILYNKHQFVVYPHPYLIKSMFQC